MIPQSNKPGEVSPRPLQFRCGDPRFAVAAIAVYVLTFDPSRELPPDQRDHSAMPDLRLAGVHRVARRPRVDESAPSGLPELIRQWKQ